MKNIQISPSILSADFSQLGNEIRRLEEGGADMIHVDVMDGHFVPNLTIGPPVIKALRKHCSLKFDVHLMISPVHKYIEAYADAGADIITIHPEATQNLRESIKTIKDLNNHKFITYGRGAPSPVYNPDWVLKLGAKEGKKRKSIMKVNSVYGLLLAVQSGVGLAALPDYIVYNVPNLTKVLPNETGKPTETHFVYPASLKNVARLKAFRNFIFSKVNEWKF